MWGGGGGFQKQEKNTAKPKFHKKESCIAKEEERKVFKVGNKTLAPLLVVKNNILIPFQKVHPPPLHISYGASLTRRFYILP